MRITEKDLVDVEWSAPSSLPLGYYMDLVVKAVNVSPHISNREKAIIEDISSVDVYNANPEILVAELHNSEGNGFQIVLESDSPNQKIGNVTN